jgi:hypothetical protein
MEFLTSFFLLILKMPATGAWTLLNALKDTFSYLHSFTQKCVFFIEGSLG